MLRSRRVKDVLELVHHVSALALGILFEQVAERNALKIELILEE